MRKVTIELPITVRRLAEAAGTRTGNVLQWLLRRGLPGPLNISTVVDPELAAEIAAAFDVELEVT